MDEMEDQQAEQDRKLRDLEKKVGDYIDQSSVYLDSEWSDAREEASNRYYGRPYGDEREGFSQVVSRDTMETIEWLLAQLLRIFVGDRFCEFEPFGPEDVEACEQQTDYTNHVLMQENGGTVLLYDWFKDALLHRLGVVHWGYCDYYEPCRESYTGLNQQQVEMLVNEPGVTIENLVPREDVIQQEVAPGQFQPQPIVLYDIQIKRIKQERKLKIEAVPGEEFIIDREARSIEDAQCVGHKRRMTKAQMRAEGVPEETLERLGDTGDADDLDNAEAYARSVDRNEAANIADDNRHWYYNLCVRFDYDGDGLDELLRVTYVNDEIITVEPAEEINYATLCPIRTPHRLLGLSVYDAVKDLERIKTVLLRQGLDNLYLTNQPQKEVVESQVNMEDLDEATVGGNIRVKAPGSITHLQVPEALGQTLNMIGYVDKVREERTGTSAASQGRDADQIHDTAKGMAQMVSQAQMRVELIARLFAEGGVKRLFVGLYNCLCRNQDPARMVRLRGKWVEIDPSDWRERNNARVSVGLGVGTKEAQTASLSNILSMQMNLLQSGLPMVTPEKIKYTLTKLIEASGYNNVQSFLAEPEEIPPPQPPPVPESIQIAQIQKGIEDEKRQVDVAKLQAQDAEAQRRHELELAKLANQDREAQRQHELKLAAEAAESRYKAAKLEQDKEQFYDGKLQEAVLKREELNQKGEEARREAEKDAKLLAAIDAPDDDGDEQE